VFLVVLAVPVVADDCGGAVLASWFAALCCLSLFSCLFFFLLLFELDFLVEESALSFAIVFLLLLVSTPGFSSGVALVVWGSLLSRFLVSLCVVPFCSSLSFLERKFRHVKLIYCDRTILFLTVVSTMIM
jgi:hypothetical protein